MADDLTKPSKLRRLMRDEQTRNATAVNPHWAEYHRLRRLLADTCGVSLREADEQVRRCLPDGTLPTPTT